MWRIFGGAALVVAGIAAFIEAGAHKPGVTYPGSPLQQVLEEHRGAPGMHVGLSTTAYDILRIGAWALVIFGALLVVVGLVRLVQSRERGGAG